MSNRISHFTTSAKPGPAPETPSPPPKKPAPRWMHTVWLVGLLITLVLLFIPTRSSKAPTSLHFSDWKTKLDAGEVKSATISQSGAVSGELKNGTKYTSRIPTAIKDDNLAADLAKHKVDVKATATSTSFWAVIGGLLPFIVLLGLYFLISRRATRQIAGGVMGIGASKAKVYDEERPTTRFADVAGYEGAKREISEVVDFLKNPERYSAAGAVGPRGVLMVGPPGTGKTLLARAVAGEADVPFFALTGSSFVEMFVGVGAARVRDLFAAARKRAPAIIFIDEVDAIGQRRGGAFVSNDEREQTLNQMLAEMDGFDPATGRRRARRDEPARDARPGAACGPGGSIARSRSRCPTSGSAPRSSRCTRATSTSAPTSTSSAVARGTPGFSGADLANLVNEAAIVAVRADRDTITAADFSEARDRILLGRREATNALMPDEKHAVAVHESGHALVAALSPHADPVAKVTILPAGQALGVTEQLPADERHLYRESYLKDSLAVRLGGRAAELLVLGEASSGAASDLAGATDLATRMVREYGMSERLGPVGFASGSPMYLGGEEVRSRDLRRGDAAGDRRGGRRPAARGRAAARSTLLAGHRDALDRLVEDLLAHETVDGDAVQAAITGEGRPTEPAGSGGPMPQVQYQARDA